MQHVVCWLMISNGEKTKVERRSDEEDSLLKNVACNLFYS